MNSPDVIVVGAGAAGIMAAWRAASLGAKVLLVEKTSRIGTKILISGGGKCNVAHAGELESVIAAFRPNEARFIRPACYRLTNRQIAELVSSRGIELYTRPDGRIFPVSSTAKGVVKALVGLLQETEVSVALNCSVQNIETNESSVTGVRLAAKNQEARAHAPRGSGFGAAALLREAMNLDAEIGSSWSGPEEVRCRRIIVATGGSSYPNSGTTGDGWPWLRALGHKIVKIRAALAPIYLETAWAGLSGISLKDCALKARVGKKIGATTRGDLLFTHHGVSGPSVLAISRFVAESMELERVTLEADLWPDEPNEALSARMGSWAAARPWGKVYDFFQPVLAQRAAEQFFRDAAVPIETIGSKLDRKSRNRLVESGKGWHLGNVAHVPLEKGEVAAGGVDLAEVDPKSMASKLVNGLYLCGEILDVAGPVGGYNLQAAFATGYLAGESAAKSLG